MSPEARAEILSLLSSEIAALGRGRLLVGIDGVDGAGKSVFADALGEVLGERRPVVRASADDFHRPRAERYRLGRDSPEGFYLDSYDYPALRALLLDPFAGRSDEVCRKVFDERSDRALARSFERVEDSSVLVFDGLFLQRDELRGYWDYSIFLDVSPGESHRRNAVRGGFDAVPPMEKFRRYLDGQAIYLTTDDPRRRATVVVDNERFTSPAIKAHRSHGPM